MKMKTTLQIERPYVHGSVQLSWVEPMQRVHIFSDALTINAVPVIIEGVLVREGDVCRFESFALQRLLGYRPNGARGNGSGKTTSRRNQERAREVVLDVMSTWAGGRVQQQTQAPMVPTASDDTLLAELLA